MAYENIRQFEGFRSTPYWDVNAWRVGYGSDTITRADGAVVPVQQGMTVTREDAERDFERRISTEFVPRVVQQIGSDAWQRLTVPQREALASVAYNYGSVPSSVVAAARGGDPAAIGQAIQGLGGHNDGINRNRRNQEAQAFLGGGAAASGGKPAVDVTKSTRFLDRTALASEPAQAGGLRGVFQDWKARRENGERPILDAISQGFSGQRAGGFAGQAQSPQTNRQGAAPVASNSLPTLSRGVGLNGAPSNDVRALQEFLNLRGANIEVDGQFGPQTEAAVRRFQQEAGVQADGVVGPQTRGAMEQAVNTMRASLPPATTEPLTRDGTIPAARRDAPVPLANPGPRVAPVPIAKPGPRNSGGQAYVDAMGARANRPAPQVATAARNAGPGSINIAPPRSNPNTVPVGQVTRGRDMTGIDPNNFRETPAYAEAIRGRQFEQLVTGQGARRQPQAQPARTPPPYAVQRPPQPQGGANSGGQAYVRAQANNAVQPQPVARAPAPYLNRAPQPQGQPAPNANAGYVAAMQAKARQNLLAGANSAAADGAAPGPQVGARPVPQPTPDQVNVRQVATTPVSGTRVPLNMAMHDPGYIGDGRFSGPAQQPQPAAIQRMPSLTPSRSAANTAVPLVEPAGGFHPGISGKPPQAGPTPEQARQMAMAAALTADPSSAVRQSELVPAQQPAGFNQRFGSPPAQPQAVDDPSSVVRQSEMGAARANEPAPQFSTRSVAPAVMAQAKVPQSPVANANPSYSTKTIPPHILEQQRMAMLMKMLQQGQAVA